MSSLFSRLYLAWYITDLQALKGGENKVCYVLIPRSCRFEVIFVPLHNHLKNILASTSEKGTLGQRHCPKAGGQAKALSRYYLGTEIISALPVRSSPPSYNS